MIHVFCDNINKEISLNFIVKIVVQKLICQILCIIQEKMAMAHILVTKIPKSHFNHCKNA